MNKRGHSIRGWPASLVAMALLGLLLAAPAPGARAQSPVDTLVATANCSATGNTYQDARFTLSSPATVKVTFDVDGTWWIGLSPAGPVLANVVNGQVLLPAG